IPSEYVFQSNEKGEIQEKHIRIQVVKMGKIKAPAKPDDEDIPSAEDNIKDAVTEISDYIVRRTPNPCDHSVGHPNVSVGTLGLLLEYIEGPTVGKALADNTNRYPSGHAHVFHDDYPMRILRRPYSTIPFMPMPKILKIEVLLTGGTPAIKYG